MNESNSTPSNDQDETKLRRLQHGEMTVEGDMFFVPGWKRQNWYYATVGIRYGEAHHTMYRPI